MAACDGESSKATPVDRGAESPAPIVGLAHVTGVDAGELEGREDPPAPAGDLKAEIEHFTTVDACINEHSRLDPILGDAIEAIGYETFLRDACRVIDAAKANDEARCGDIDSSPLAARCRATVAEVAASPEKCPWEIADRPARGRVPACIAVATRDARLCAAVADGVNRATCEATLRHEESPCGKLRTPAQQARCARDAARWRTVIPTAAASEPFVVAGTLHVERAEGDDATPAIGGPIAVDLTPDLERGVTIFEQYEGTRIAIGPLSEAGLDFIAPSPNSSGSLALELMVPAGSTNDTGTVRLVRAELLLPGRPPVATQGTRSTLVVKLVKLVRARGSVLKIVVDGTLGTGVSSLRLHAEETTFVRDVVTLPDVYGRISKLGGEGGMR
jgi:hypothetical protein